jgi:Kef-type K+ transport system membrane component KefB/nucleotide-binding universal stress UspA family protein
VFLLLLQVCLLLVAARTLGEICRQLKQPLVVGELLAGVLLGPSMFGLVAPDLQAAIFPLVQSQADLLSVVAWIGVLFLLILTGLETDVRLILQKGKTALLISLGGILIPFGTGLVLGYALPERFVRQPELRLVFALFMAVAMSISAVPVIAKVLVDLKLVRRDIGQLTLAAAMTDDTIGWILLSVVAGLAARGVVDVGSIVISVGAALFFLAFSFTIGGKIVSGIITVVDRTAGGATSQFSAIVAISFAAAAFTQQMGIEAVLGAFVMGILAGQARRFRAEVGHALELVTAGFLAPIFFASAGLKVDLIRMLNVEVLTVGGIVLAVACFGKFAGCYLGAWVGGLSHWERLAMGSGMNARGAMEIIVATVGLGLGVLNLEMYSVIVMIAIVTSLMAAPLLRWTLSHVELGEDEAKRLAREEEALSSFVRSIRRVLLVARSKEQAELSSQIVTMLNSSQQIEVTAIYADVDAEPWSWWQIWGTQSRRAWQALQSSLREIRQVVRQLPGSSSTLKVVTGAAAVEHVIKEASRGYDLILMSVGQTTRSGESLFGRVVDRILQESPCPTFVLRAAKSGQANGAFKRILVPTIGTEYSKNAVETASVLAQSTGAALQIVHVVGTGHGSIPGTPVNLERERQIGQEIVEHQAEIGRKLGAQVETTVLEASSPEGAILDLAKRENVDLIVMGTSVRTLQRRAFFGHRAEALLELAPCAVAVISRH